MKWNAPPVSAHGTAVTVHERTRSDRVVSFRAQWRALRPGGPTSATFAAEVAPGDSVDSPTYGKVIERTRREACAFARHARLSGVEDALRVWRDREAAATQGTFDTVKEAWDRYLDEVATHAKPGTVAKYRSRVAAAGSWLPRFESYALGSLTRDHVSQWVRDRSAQTRTVRGETRPLAAKTVKSELMLLSQLMNDAVKRDLVPANPCRDVKAPKVYRKAVEPLTAEEFNTFRAALPPWWRPFVETLASTGMRINEATALRWQDVRLDQALLTVQHGYSDAGTNQPGGDARWRLEAPKTQRSVRTIDLDQETVDTLAYVRARSLSLGRSVAGDAHVFTAPRGGQVRDNPFREDVWHPAREAAGLRVCTPHDMRHLHASIMLAGGASIEDVSERLGHENTHITYATYSHLVVSRRQRMVAAITAAMHGFDRTSSTPLALTGGDVEVEEPGEL